MKAEILILGVLQRGNLHPYEIKRRLTNAMIQCFTDVDVGTLYYAVRELSKKKLIAAVSRKRVVRGGIKTVYRITPAGKQRFQQLLHEQFALPGTVAQSLYIAMLFLHFSDLSRVTTLLQEKIARQKVAIEELQFVERFEVGGLEVLGQGTADPIGRVDLARGDPPPNGFSRSPCRFL